MCVLLYTLANITANEVNRQKKWMLNFNAPPSQTDVEWNKILNIDSCG